MDVNKKREILFRGKTEQGIWFEGSLHKYKIETPSKTETHYKIQEFNFGYNDENEMDCAYMSGFDEEVIPETIGQFTGLTDMNGKKIFEGDILAEYFGEIYGVVKYGEGSFDGGILKYTGFYCESSSIFHDGNLCDESNKDYWNKHQVIGNIYDNPELLKLGKWKKPKEKGK